MPKLSAALLLYRTRAGAVEVLLGHPGGPFWTRRDDGAWSILKGEYESDEDPWAAAQREFREEVGLDAPQGPCIDLGTVQQPSGKLVTTYAVEGDLDVTGAHSNEFELEWPPKSGVIRSFPEIDRVAWFTLGAAHVKVLGGQRPILDRLASTLGGDA